MSGKAPIAITLLALICAGCSTVRETPASASAPAPAAAVPAPKPKPTPLKKRSTVSRPVQTPKTPQPATTPPRPAATINANVTRETGNSLLVTRGTTTAAVPLFRQAIVLANVRASVASLPNPPEAEFRQGLLTLTFPPGSQSEATAAINKALSIPEVTRLRANLPQ